MFPVIEFDRIVSPSGDRDARKLFFGVWEKLGEYRGVACADLEVAFERWFKAMSGRQGWYHSWSHLFELLYNLNGNMKDRAATIHDPEAITWAILFHDAIYRPGRRDNEEKSAELAKQCMVHLRLPNELIDRVARLILATRNHGARENRESADPDLKVFLDLDMQILASSATIYNCYLEGLRLEYARLPIWLLARGRKRWIRSVLTKDPLFLTEAFRERFEAQARRNLNEELERGWGLLGLRGLYDPSKHSMKHYLQARRFFEAHREQWLQQQKGQCALVGPKGLIRFFALGDYHAMPSPGSDDQFTFIVRSVAEEREFLLGLHSSVYSALIESFLDTDVPEDRHNAKLALRLCGAPGPIIFFLKVLIGTGAWWNIIAWEWAGIPYVQFKHWLRLNAIPAVAIAFAFGLSHYGFSIAAFASAVIGGLAALVWAALVVGVLQSANRWLFGTFKIAD